MLCGASLSLSTSKTQQVSLVMCRARTLYKQLAWFVIFMEKHNVRMHLKSGDAAIHSFLAYQSRGDHFLYESYARWYPPAARRVAVTPDDLSICENTLAVWSASALARARKGKPLNLQAPNLSPAVAKKLATQVRRLGWANRVIIEGDAAALQISVVKRPELEQWVAGRIPRAVWGVGAEGNEGEIFTKGSTDARSV